MTCPQATCYWDKVETLKGEVLGHLQQVSDPDSEEGSQSQGAEECKDPMQLDPFSMSALAELYWILMAAYPRRWRLVSSGHSRNAKNHQHCSGFSPSKPLVKAALGGHLCPLSKGFSMGNTPVTPPPAGLG